MSTAPNSTGIGLATTKPFVKEGPMCLSTGVGKRSWISLIGKNVTAVQGDVSTLEDLDYLYEVVRKEKGRVDVVFANTGVVDPVLFTDSTPDTYDKHFNLNARGVYFTVQKALTCWIRFGVPALFAISGMNKTDSALCATQKSPGSPDDAFIIASPGCCVDRAVPRTAFYFIPSAMTGFIAKVSPYRNRVSLQEASEVLEPDEGKLSCPVLRGWATARLPGHSIATAATAKRAHYYRARYTDK